MKVIVGQGKRDEFGERDAVLSVVTNVHVQTVTLSRQGVVLTINSIIIPVNVVVAIGVNDIIIDFGGSFYGTTIFNVICALLL